MFTSANSADGSPSLSSSSLVHDDWDPEDAISSTLVEIPVSFSDPSVLRMV